MAISAVTGVTASNASAATSIVTGTFAATATHDIVVAVAIATTTASVSSITDTAGNTYVLMSSATNSGNVRVELWQSQNVAANASNAVTVTVSASSLLAVAIQTYSGTSNNNFSPLDRTGWTATTNDAGFGAAQNVLDGNTGTLWATNATIPCWCDINMQSPKTFARMTVLPRQDGFADNPGDIEVYVSTDGSTWGTAIYTQTGMPNNSLLRTFNFTSQTKQWVRYKINAIASGSRPFQGACEINVGAIVAVPSQNTGSGTGTGWFPGQRVTVQDNGGYHVGALAFASTSGDTFTAPTTSYTIRRSVVPALTSVAVAIVDQLESAGATSNLVEARLSASRNWASAGLELRSGVAGSTFLDYTGRLPVDGTIMGKEQRLFGTMPSFATSTPSGLSPVPFAQVIKGGTKGVGYTETISTAGGTGPFTYSVITGSLPAGTTLDSSTGIISGIPTTASTYNFTIRSTDSAGHTGSQLFTITIGATMTANFGFVA